MRRTRINKGCERGINGIRIRIRIGDREWSRVNEQLEGIRVRKSRCVETTLLRHITKFNVISSGCGVPEIALYFFKSEGGAAVAALLLAADDEDFGQSLAI